MGETALPWPPREPAPTDPLAARMARAVQALVPESGQEPLAREIVAHAVDLLPCAAHAALLVPHRGGRLLEMAATSLVACEADRSQVALGEGPCLDVGATDRPSGHVGRDLRERWPRWGAEAVGLGLRDVLVAPLAAGPGGPARLVWYGERPGSVSDPDDVEAATVFAVHAGQAFAAARLVDNLRAALESRHGIGVAQGILMERYGLTVEASFNTLRRTSSESNTKLVEVARQVVDGA